MRYNSSRAKCIKCGVCNLFFSPNKFIFHFHRTPEASYNHPDAANFNSWRRHLKLSERSPSEDIACLWEEVKAMFNGGSRKRVPLGDDLVPDMKRSKRPVTPPPQQQAPSIGGAAANNAFSANPVISGGSLAAQKLHPAFSIPFMSSRNVMSSNTSLVTRIIICMYVCKVRIRIC